MLAVTKSPLQRWFVRRRKGCVLLVFLCDYHLTKHHITYGNSIRMQSNMKKVISVFGSSRPSEEDQEYKLAYEVGKHLAIAGFIVCNGGYGGVMEASARGAKEAGGETIGITVDVFPRRANQWIGKEIRPQTLVERLVKLVDAADAYVILKGGTGTLLELAYVWEFINKRLIQEKPIVVVGDFWSGVIATLRDELMWEGLGDCTRFIHQVNTPEQCAAFLKNALTR